MEKTHGLLIHLGRGCEPTIGFRCHHNTATQKTRPILLCFALSLSLAITTKFNILAWGIHFGALLKKNSKPAEF
ncbi:hypothetical protein Q3G72_005919 [Acer saccharum]|nr:hypothetical protein Q3G72_005919 [Acer saccharum]